MAVKKIYYSMGEVAEMFDVNQSLIRHWEAKFDCLKPHKNAKGNRMFTEADVERLKQIYHLVKECGMTLKGAAKVMRHSSQDELARQTELLERLQRVRAVLVEVREELKTDDDDQIVEPQEIEEAAATAEPVVEQKPLRAVVEKFSDEEEPAPAQKKRAPRRKKKSDEESKELFPFYEQSLF